MAEQFETRDFFISFTSADFEVAAALNAALKGAGYSTWFHPEDKPRGGGIAEWMYQAVEQSTQMIAVCSEAYFADEKVYSRSEWQAMFWADPLNKIPLLLLAKTDACALPKLIAQSEYCDLGGKTAVDAGAALLVFLNEESQRKARIEAAGVQAHPEIFRLSGGANRYFTGRTAELSRLHEILMKGEKGAAITAVDGMGGVGKTTLAREYALRYGKRGRFAGVWWLEAEEESSLLDGLERLARRDAVDVSPGRDARETAEDVVEWLGAQTAAKPWLIIFDNAPNAEAVRRWLPGGSSRVIITSRNKYFGDIATPMPLDVWEEAATVRFLIDRAGRGTEAEARALATAIGNLPLAAEQAGAFLAQNAGIGFAAYEARLLELMKEKPAYMAGDYPLPLYAAFEASIEAIEARKEGEAALALLTLCAFLAPEGVELGLLTAAAGRDHFLPDPLRAALRDEFRREAALSALRDYSLFRQQEDPDRGATLHLHRLMRQVAAERAGEDGRQRWGGAAARMVGGTFPFVDTDTWTVCARLTPHAVALAPLDLTAPEAAKAQDYLLNQAAIYLDARGDRPGAIRLLRRSVEIMEGSRQEEPLEIAAALGNLAGNLAGDEAGWEEAEALYRRALEIKEVHLPPGDPSLAITLSNFGGLHRRRKAFEEAARLSERAAEIWKAAKGETSAEYALGLSNLAAVYGDWVETNGDRALREKEAALKRQALDVMLAARGPRHPATAALYNNLAVMHAQLGDMAEAATAMAQAVAIDLSLDLLQHPVTQSHIDHLLHLWTESGQAEKAGRLRGDDFSDLLPIVQEIEARHRQWVAEDPETRHFGPPSPVTGARE